MSAQRVCLKTLKTPQEPTTYNRTLDPADVKHEFTAFGGSDALIGGANVLPDHGSHKFAHYTQTFGRVQAEKQCCHPHAHIYIHGNAMSELVHLRACDSSECTDFSRKMQ